MTQQPSPDRSGMLSLKQVREVLGEKAKGMDLRELARIRDGVFIAATIALEIIRRERRGDA